MYTTLLTLHSIFRWLVLIALIYAMIRAYMGLSNKGPFTKADNTSRALAVTMTHIQFLIGIILYFVSPLISVFLNDFGGSMANRGLRFFGMEHNLMMLVAVILITVGSAKAKRRATDYEKFKTIAIWFTIALVIILMAIPWPFSPMASRPYFRGF